MRFFHLIACSILPLARTDSRLFRKGAVRRRPNLPSFLCFLSLFVTLVACNNEGYIATSAGAMHTCALHSEGTIFCWGENSAGQLGDGSTTVSNLPVAVPGIHDAIALTANDHHTCVVHQGGSVSCWGNNILGQIGQPTSYPSFTPITVQDVNDAVALASGNLHTCALHADGTISCWGQSSWGQLGNEPAPEVSLPILVQGINDAIALTAGGNHTCAVHQGGTVSCWGRNDFGQLGNNSHTNAHTPVAVQGVRDVIALTAGSSHTCAVHQEGTVSCWGHRGGGVLEFKNRHERSPTDTSSSLVTIPNIDDAIAIASYSYHTCALRKNGSVICWGDNSYGQLGAGSSDSRSSLPLTVKTIDNAIAITAGNYHACAIHHGGTMSCWGLQHKGQLGDGAALEMTFSAIPVPVQPPVQSDDQ